MKTVQEYQTYFMSSTIYVKYYSFQYN